MPGPREGARALNLTGNIVTLDALPASLRRLSASEIEDCLCIYKAELKGTRLRLSKREGE
jgi:hypothetical protein